MTTNAPERDHVLCCWPHSGVNRIGAYYRIAEIVLCSNISIPSLAPFHTDHHHNGPIPEPTPKTEAAPKRRMTTTGWLAEQWRTVSCTIQSGCHLLHIEGLGHYSVSRNEITALDPDTPPHDAIITGPCLILALAMRDVFTLHASAVALDGRAIAFAGGSGKGKSTLARWVSDLQPDERETVRIADDLLPVAVLSQGITALPHFPQLKLSHREQYTDLERPTLPLRALFVLDEAAGDNIAIEPLPAKQAMMQIIRHTVAARLFGAELNQAHLAFAARCARQLPVYRLHYPRRLDTLPELFEQILALQTTWPASR